MEKRRGTGPTGAPESIPLPKKIKTSNLKGGQETIPCLPPLLRFFLPFLTLTVPTYSQKKGFEYTTLSFQLPSIFETPWNLQYSKTQRGKMTQSPAASGPSTAAAPPSFHSLPAALRFSYIILRSSPGDLLMSLFFLTPSYVYMSRPALHLSLLPSLPPSTHTIPHC